MALFNRKKNEDALVQRIVEEVSKAGNSMTSTPYGNSGYSTATAAQPSNMERSGGQGLLQTPGFQANPLPRPATDFGSQLGPAAPFLPAPLDPVFDDSGRALPRIWEYPVAWNLDLNQRSTPWSVLRSMADQIDIIHRSIELKVSEIVKLNWSFTIEDSTINTIMSEENCSHAKASGIARDRYSKDISTLREFWENPYPQLGRTFSEWMTEFLWQHFVFDGTPVYPRYNLGKEVIGFEIVDAPTIKVLLDNRGAIPAPPSPAYQQVLWGFPRGEYQSTEESDGEFFNGPGKNNEYLRDQLAYFVRNRRTWSPYGFSAVEEAVPAATLYLERQRWMKSEYQDGAAPLAFFETDSDEMDHLRLAAFERIFNDRMSGQTSERHRMKVLPKGFKPIFAPTVDERYKDTYDHFLIMRIATIFGVAPSALGVVARSGLGGSGERAGEAQSALSISQKPLEGFLTETINTLSRRFLGTDKNVTFSFDDTDDNVQQMESKAKAYQTSLSSAQMTLNDVRGELGLPLYDMPEADEPFILGAGGAPTFLKGQLEMSQSGETIGQKTEGAANDEATQGQDTQSAQSTEVGQETPNPSDGKSEEDKTGVSSKSVVADEMRDFAQFVKARTKRGNWRAFDFSTVEESVAEKLNEEGYFISKGVRPMPEKFALWAIEFVEGQIKDTPKETSGLLTKDYNPDQERDARGRFGSGGGLNQVQQAFLGGMGATELDERFGGTKEHDNLVSAMSMWTGQRGGVERIRTGLVDYQSGKTITDPEVKAVSAEIATLLNNAPAIDSEVYRGAGFSIQEFGDLQRQLATGVIDLPLSSFTTDVSVARDFTAQGRTKTEPVVFQVETGAKGLNVADYSAFPNEKEIISGGRFQVLSVGERGDGPYGPTPVTVKLKQVG